ncbi:HNH endonuclease signature motif containing protein, partial [uncultured Aeromicrobium sp.]
GTCAGPGCHGPVVHVHHIQYWSDGGPTDLANLIGLCPRCHSAVHQGFFTIDPDTHQTHRTLRTQRTSRRARAG